MQNCITALDFCNAILHSIYSTMKTKGQQPQVTKPEPLAFCCSGEVPEWSNGAALQAAKAGQAFTGSNPVLSATLNSPADSANYLRGLTSGLRQRLGFYAHSHFDACSRRKQGRNDLPFVPDRNSEGR